MDKLNSIREEWEKIRRSSLARNAGWMFMGQGFSVLCQGAYFIFLGRLLGSAEYGIYVGAVAMASILSQYSPFGSHSVLLRYVSSDPKKFASYWANVLVTTVTLGSLLVAFLTLAGPHLAHSCSWPLLFCVGLGDCLATQLTVAASRVFQAFENMRITAALGMSVSFLRALIAGFMLWRLYRGTATEWALAALIVSSFAACIALVLVTRIYGPPALSIKLLRQRAGEGFVFALSYSTTGVYNDIDKAMLGHFGMNAANGIYTMAYRVIDVFTMPIYAVQGAVFPRFFRKGVEGAGSTAEFAVRIVKRTAPLALVCALVMLLSAPIIPYLAGKSFGESAMALRWLCLLPFFRSFQLSAGDAITAAGHQKLRLGSQTTAAAFNFCVNLYLIPLYSWRGAAWSSLATDGLLALFNWTVLLWLASARGFENKMVGEELS
jgi:O-antigen/teichoic acid export membrane protein